MNLFIKYFINPFVDIALTFFDSLFRLFLLKSNFLTILATLLLLAKFAGANLAVKLFSVNLLNY